MNNNPDLPTPAVVVEPVEPAAADDQPRRPRVATLINTDAVLAATVQPPATGPKIPPFVGD